MRARARDASWTFEVRGRHAGALRQIRQHRMRGIAQQRDTSFGPLRQRRAVKHGPLVQLVRFVHKLIDVRMPFFLGLQNFLFVALDFPRFFAPVLLEEGGPIDQVAAAHLVGDDGRARTEPGRHVL